MKRKNIRKISIGLLLFTLLFCGCWPFMPREAENPSNILEPRTAVTPTQVLEILQEIYMEKLPAGHLAPILHENFLFYPDPSLPVGSHGWEKQSEIDATNSIMTSYSPFSLVFYPIENTPDQTVIPNVSVWMARTYWLTGRNSLGVDKAFSGKSEFLVEYDAGSGEWLLKQWNDFRMSETPSWGELKLENR